MRGRGGCTCQAATPWRRPYTCQRPHACGNQCGSDGHWGPARVRAHGGGSLGV